MSFTTILLQVQATGADSIEKAKDTVLKSQEIASISVFEMIGKGGWVMIPVGLALLFCIYFIIERILYINKRSAMSRDILHRIKDNLKEGKLSQVQSYVESIPTAQAQVLSTGMRFVGGNAREIESAMEARAEVEVSAMEGPLHYLSVISKLAPMFGFLGTILGVIQIFYGVSTGSGAIEIQVISNGLYQKLISSASGLTVGMISGAAHGLFLKRIDTVRERLQEQILGFMEMMNRSNL